jgi:hypothetical protein
MNSVPAEIFRAYDIRGIVGRTLTPAVVRAHRPGAGHARRWRPASRAIAIGRDGRLSGPELSAALADGIAASGADVIDVGMVRHAGDLLRRAPPRLRLQRDGDRQPQSAGLQRHQDGDRRQHAFGRGHPGAARSASNPARRAQRPGQHIAARRRPRPTWRASSATSGCRGR